MGDGLSNRQIADDLERKTNTIKAHAASIYSRLNVHSRVQAVLILYTAGVTVETGYHEYERKAPDPEWRTMKVRRVR